MLGKEKIKLIECPRDAMQGLKHIVATPDKISYLNLLLQAGFDTLDFGSFVSPRAVPQMADTAEVLAGLDLQNTETKLLAIVANLRGLDDAIKYPEISYIGFPFSISETFQKRNANTDIKNSLSLVENLLEKCDKSAKTAVIYLSMAFGNPYGDEWNEGLVGHWVDQLSNRGASIIALSDTVGTSIPQNISAIYSEVKASYSNIELGLHLHSRPESWKEKIEAAYTSGCRRFDSAIKGFGGCPMAADELIGNIATENLIAYFANLHEETGVNEDALQKALSFSSKIFY
jgi:hydroxymethylglutaryl-CoA lyase